MQDEKETKEYKCQEELLKNEKQLKMYKLKQLQNKELNTIKHDVKIKFEQNKEEQINYLFQRKSF